MSQKVIPRDKKRSSLLVVDGSVLVKCRLCSTWSRTRWTVAPPLNEISEATLEATRLKHNGQIHQ